MEKLSGLNIVNAMLDCDNLSTEELSKAINLTYNACDTVNDIIRILDNKRYSDEAMRFASLSASSGKQPMRPIPVSTAR